MTARSFRVISRESTRRDWRSGCPQFMLVPPGDSTRENFVLKRKHMVSRTGASGVTKKSNRFVTACDRSALHVIDLSLHLTDLSLHVIDLSLHVTDLSLHVTDLSLHVTDQAYTATQTMSNLVQHHMDFPTPSTCSEQIVEVHSLAAIWRLCNNNGQYNCMTTRRIPYLDQFVAGKCWLPYLIKSSDIDLQGMISILSLSSSNKKSS